MKPLPSAEVGRMDTNREGINGELPYCGLRPDIRGEG